MAVRYSSVAHYLLDRAFSFLTIELAFTVSEPTNGIAFVLDGLLPNREQLALLKTSTNFRELVGMSESNVEPDATGVWNFASTFFRPTLPTNLGYEGPPEWQAIRVVQEGARVRYLGQEAAVPTLGQARVRVEGSVSMLSLTGALRRDELQLVRIGCFLRRPSRHDSRGWLGAQFAERPTSTFAVRYFSYGLSDIDSLQRLGVDARIKQTVLSLTLRWFAERGGQDVTDYGSQPAADVWLVGYGARSVRIRSPRLRVTPTTFTRRTGLGLYPQPRERTDSAFWETHIVLSANLPQLDGLDEVATRVENDLDALTLEIEVPGVTLRGIFSWLFRYYLPPVALLMSLSILAGPGLVSSSIAASVGYLVALFSLLWARHHIPRVRALLESEAR